MIILLIWSKVVKFMRINEVFKITYPKTLIYSEMTPDKGGINFVSSQDKHNGIVGRVKMETGIKIYPAGCITVPLKGSVLMAHLQPEPCYVAHQIAVLEPFDTSMSYIEKLYYVTCIRYNAFKYNYGRQADKTLGDIELPIDNTTMLSKVHSLHCKPLSTTNQRGRTSYTLDVESWKEFCVGDLFEVKKGKRLTSDDQTDGETPYIGAIDSNNGVANYIGQTAIHDDNTISLSYNGSVGEAFYQPRPFWATDDVNVLYFKKENGIVFNKYIALFICAVLRQEKYRYSYGRKWVLESMRTTIIKLPEKDGRPDYGFMESYMKALPYGDRI